MSANATMLLEAVHNVLVMAFADRSQRGIQGQTVPGAFAYQMTIRFNELTDLFSHLTTRRQFALSKEHPALVLERKTINQRAHSQRAINKIKAAPAKEALALSGSATYALMSSRIVTTALPFKCARRDTSKFPRVQSLEGA